MSFLMVIYSTTKESEAMCILVVVDNDLCNWNFIEQSTKYAFYLLKFVARWVRHLCTGFLPE